MDLLIRQPGNEETKADARFKGMWAFMGISRKPLNFKLLLILADLAERGIYSH